MPQAVASIFMSSIMGTPGRLLGSLRALLDTHWLPCIPYWTPLGASWAPSAPFWIPFVASCAPWFILGLSWISFGLTWMDEIHKAKKLHNDNGISDNDA